MKNSEKMVLVVLGCAALPALAQSPGAARPEARSEARPAASVGQQSAPQCAITNFDQARNAFTVISPAAGAVNQQCFFTVMPKDQSSMGTVLPVLAEYPAPRLMEGQYLITLSGGGGGGGGGSSTAGGGGGGAGALPVQVTQHLAPGIYRMTIGTGGAGGAGCQMAQNGGLGADGNPTGISEAYTGNVIAGFPRAEYWAGSTRLNYNLAANTAASPTTGARSANEVSVADVNNGQGAPAIGGQSVGGDGGRITPAAAAKAADGGMLKEVGYPGLPGKGGDGYLPSGATVALAGGGGGGAGYGHGGDGQSGTPNNVVAQAGELGGGGGGGAGGPNLCGAGGMGGHGFIAIKPL